MAASTKSSLHFDVHPSVIFQLGADLVSDDMQALLELLKNSYDANAREARVTVETSGAVVDSAVGKKIHSFFPDAEGSLLVQDDGEGMSSNTIEEGWMVVSGSAKRALKATRRTEDGGPIEWPEGEGRVPLGDKGLGRLGTQLLGANVEVITWQRGDERATHIGYSWDDFRKKSALKEVEVRRKRVQIPSKKPSGTLLLISGLVDQGSWRERGKKPEMIAGKLASMLSPFFTVSEFRVRLTVDGERISTELFAERFRDEAEIHYDYAFDPARGLLLEGVCKADVLKPGTGKPLAKQFAVAMRGKERSTFAKNLASELARRLKTATVEPQRGAYFLSWSRSIPLEELGLEGDPQRRRHSPGPFSGEIGSFDFTKTRAHNTARDLKDFWGVYIYRDGFGVRAERDLLKLGLEVSSGKSWYSLRPGNTIGYVAISTASNGSLEEKSDREGFKDSVASRNFSRVLTKTAQLINEELSALRRGSTKVLGGYVKGDQESPARSTEPSGSTDLVATATEIMEDLGKPSEQVIPSAKAKLRSLVGELTLLRTSEDERLERDEKMTELVGLGLSAESLTHELRHVAENLFDRSRKFLRRKLDTTSIDFGGFVKVTASALRRQIDIFEPSLRRSRDRRESIKMVDFLMQMQELYGERETAAGVDFKIFERGGEDMTVLVSRGLLMQVVDNLVRNSLYWVRRTRGEQRITFEVQSPYVWVSDTGPGFAKSIEGLLFEEPFVSRKTSTDRRGLGLYISRIFMRRMGGDLSFYEDRNEAGRYYALELDFSGAVKR